MGTIFQQAKNQQQSTGVLRTHHVAVERGTEHQSHNTTAKWQPSQEVSTSLILNYYIKHFMFRCYHMTVASFSDQCTSPIAQGDRSRYHAKVHTIPLNT